MLRKAFFVILLLLLVGTSYAQDYRFEITPFIGYDFTSDVSIEQNEVNGYLLNKLKIGSGLDYGFIADVSLNEQVQFEFIWSRVDSALGAYGTPVGGGPSEEVDFSDMSIDNFHFNVLFQMGYHDEMVLPFFFGGLGGSRFNPDAEGVGSETKFSINLGGGVKVFFSDHVGLRLQGRWIPTFIQSGEGLWCDWYGWCWSVPVGSYLHQFEMTAGVAFRF